MKTFFQGLGSICAIVCILYSGYQIFKPLTPEEKYVRSERQREAFERDLKWDDCWTIGKNQWVYRFDGNFKFPLDQALKKLVDEHPDRRVVSTSPIVRDGHGTVGYWVVVEVKPTKVQ